jgi:hypothetical protein
MREASAPDWLSEFQQRFGAVLREPLDRATGTLTARTDHYMSETVSEVRGAANATAAARLAVYNRQYWFRLFGVLQTAYPLTTRLLGAWRFNAYAQAFLIAHPPRTWTLDHVPDGFDDALPALLGDDPARAPVTEAARLDAHWRALFHAPVTPPYRPDARDAARLADGQLVPSPSVVIVEERWPLVALRHTLTASSPEAPLALPLPHEAPAWWALCAEPTGIRTRPLAPREGRLLTLLAHHPVRDALARLEAETPPEARASLPADTQRWLARSVAHGWWAGLADTPPNPMLTE